MFTRKAVAKALGGTVDRFGFIHASMPWGEKVEIALDQSRPDGFLVRGRYSNLNLEHIQAHVRSRLWDLLDG